MSNPIDNVSNVLFSLGLLIILPITSYLLHSEISDTFFWMLCSGVISVLVTVFISPFILIFMYLFSLLGNSIHR